ncbi:peptidase dimerization domain-containing protein [Deinococcus multiflagellatus]|uniref:Peptidase dimerization domain-containing protein n=1 Tax=Deinococcus multiflagellatus TaxID=1656887 RepID=A0ABW1ZKS8_9DEIO
MNVNGFHGGYGGEGSKTVLPAAGMVKLDFRLVPDQDPERVVALLRAHLDAQGFGDIEIVELESHQHPARSDLAHPFVQTAVRVAQEVHGQAPILNPSSGGSGPMYPFMRHVGAPVVALGIGNVGGGCTRRTRIFCGGISRMGFGLRRRFWGRWGMGLLNPFSV